MLHDCDVTAQELWLAALSSSVKECMLHPMLVYNRMLHPMLVYIDLELLDYQKGLSLPCSAGIPVWISWFKYLSFIFYGESA